MVRLLSTFKNNVLFSKKKISNLITVFRTYKTASSESSQMEVTNSWEERLKITLKRYEDLFGITKLTEMHEHVLKAQSRVHEVQQKRRKVQEDILNVQNKLQEIQSKLEKISRGDDMFLSVVTQEHELIKQQKHLQNLLAVCDQTEREEQTALALAINNSQDHERTYREKNKYISLITGVVGGCIGVIGSSINNWRHRKDIKIFAYEIKDMIEQKNSINSEKMDNSYENSLQKICMLSDRLNEFFPKNDTKTILDQVERQTNDLIRLVSAQQEALSSVADNVHSYVSSDTSTAESFHSDIFMRKILYQVDNKMEQRLKSHSYATAFFISTSVLVMVVTFYVINRH